MKASSITSIRLSLQDRVFLGEGLFETMRFVQGAVCYSKLHWERLKDSAVTLGIPFLLSFSEWQQLLHKSIAEQSIQEGGVKVILTAGAAPRGLTQRGYAPELFCEVFSYEPNVKPLCLVSAPWTRDAKNPIYAVKSVNYLEAILARRFAESVGADDVLFFNHQGYALESSVANVFALVDGVLQTPALNVGILPGVIRARIIALAQAHGLMVLQHPIDKALLMRAESLFVCNALLGIQAVQSLDGHLYHLKSEIQALLAGMLQKDATSSLWA